MSDVFPFGLGSGRLISFPVGSFVRVLKACQIQQVLSLDSSFFLPQIQKFVGRIGIVLGGEEKCLINCATVGFVEEDLTGETMCQSIAVQWLELVQVNTISFVHKSLLMDFKKKQTKKMLKYYINKLQNCSSLGLAPKFVEIYLKKNLRLDCVNEKEKTVATIGILLGATHEEKKVAVLLGNPFFYVFLFDEMDVLPCKRVFKDDEAIAMYDIYYLIQKILEEKAVVTTEAKQCLLKIELDALKKEIEKVSLRVQLLEKEKEDKNQPKNVSDKFKITIEST